MNGQVVEPERPGKQAKLDPEYVLADLLIRAFANESSHSRRLLSNNSHMVGLQIKLELGQSAYNSLSSFSSTDWKSAWILFDAHYQN